MVEGVRRPQSSVEAPACCGNKKGAMAYCFWPDCRFYVCADCLAKHVGHPCIKLGELTDNIKGVAEAELERVEQIIADQTRHIQDIKEGEDAVRKIVNDQKQTVVNVLWEIYRLINDCLVADIESHTFFLNQLADKRREMEAKQKKTIELRGLLKAAREGAAAVKKLEDSIIIYTTVFDKHISDSDVTALKKDIAETSKRTSKYKYDQLNNKFMGLMATFIEDLRKKKGGLEELDDKYKRPDAKNIAKYKDVRKDYKEKLLPYISPFAYYLKESTNEVVMYNIKADRGLRLKIDNWKFLKYMDSTMVGTTIYFSGGGLYEKSTFEYDYVLNCNRAERKSDMNVGRNLHKLIPIGRYRLLSICGQGPDGPLDVCETFEIPENIWKFAPTTNERKYGVAPMCFDCRYVYIFGGFTIQDGVDRFLSSIEVLDLKPVPQAWKILQLAAAQVLRPCMDMAAVQVSKTQILVFGGYDGEFKKSAWLFAPQEGSLTAAADMEAGESFNARKPVTFAGQAFVVGYHHKDVHMFDVKEGKWKVVQAEGWLIRALSNMPPEEDA